MRFPSRKKRSLRDTPTKKKRKNSEGEEPLILYHMKKYIKVTCIKTQDILSIENSKAVKKVLRK